MSNYKHGNWRCKAADEAEAKEIIERAVASGAVNRLGIIGTKSNYYGVIDGLVICRIWRGEEYTIEQVREKFPLPGEQVNTKWNGEGLPPAGVGVEVLHQGRWIGATTVGVFGHQRECMVCAPNGGGFYGFFADEIRPIRIDRERWVEDALSILQKDPVAMPAQLMGMVYDALKSGDLKAPE